MSKVSDVISKVESLLRVVEDEGASEGERENAQSLAQSLMTKYQIEEAQLNGRVKDEEITRYVHGIANPYTIDRIMLLSAIARNNYCKLLRGKNYAVLYGYDSDIKMVIAMYKILETHMITEMWKELKKFREMNPYSSTSTVSWKKSFFAGYAQTIDSRLARAKKEQIDSVAKETNNDEFALVLVSKQKLIDNFFDQVPKGYSSPRTLGSSSGYGAGKASGGRADIGQARISHTKALGR